jgi:hypothetical protein
MKMRVRGAALVAMITVLTGCGATMSSPDNVKSVGDMTPKTEDKDLGLVAVAPGLDLKAYSVVVVNAFAVTDSAVKDDGDRRTAAQMSTFFQNELVRRLKETGLFPRVVSASETDFKPAPGDKVLRLDGTITRLGEGSQVARYFAGIYGAGRTRAQAELQFVDPATNRVMIAAADRRIAQIGVFGGDSKGHLRESFDDMARDLGKFLVRLSKGEAPTKK